MLPRAAYVHEAVFGWEMRSFFAGGWICVGRGGDVPEPGDQTAVALGRGGVLLTRDMGGRMHAFANTCRHRGHELLQCGQTAHREIVLCPYHNWSYRLDGSLRRAPHYNEVEGFDKADFGLVELPVAEWHGLLFVDGSGDSGPFAGQVEGLDELLAPYELERLQVAASHDYVVSSNWKLLVENYQECYHCPSIHPELCVVTDPASGSEYVHSGVDPDRSPWVGGWMSLRDGVETMSLDGRSGGTPFRGLDERHRRIVDYITVFPNLLLSLHPDYVMSHRLTPLAPDRTSVECSWAFAPEDLGRAGFDPAYAVDFWDVTNREDWGACESVQRGLSSEHAIPGVLSPAEMSVYQFVTIVARRYLALRSPSELAGR